MANDTATRLAAWRTIHRIDPVEDEHPTFGRITRCSVDGIRVNWITKAWRHDRLEIVALLDQEYGGPWGFPKEAMDARDQLVEEGTATFDEDEEWTNREGMPEFNGSFR